MAQPKGSTGNPNGRPKGALNKTTKTLKEWITTFIDENKEQIESDWLSLEPKERVVLFEKMLRYVIPTQVKAEIEEKPQQQLELIITGKKFAQLPKDEFGNYIESDSHEG